MVFVLYVLGIRDSIAIVLIKKYLSEKKNCFLHAELLGFVLGFFIVIIIFFFIIIIIIYNITTWASVQRLLCPLRHADMEYQALNQHRRNWFVNIPQKIKNYRYPTFQAGKC